MLSLARCLLTALLTLGVALPAIGDAPVSRFDGQLADRAALIAEVTLLARDATSDPAAIDYTVRVERLLKGSAPATTLVVRVLLGYCSGTKVLMRTALLRVTH